MHPPSRLVVALIILLVSAGLALAQTDDYEEEDRRYQERLSRPTPPPAGSEKQAVIATADRLIRDSKDYTSKSTPHWQVRTDDPGVDVAASAALLEGFRTWFDSFWKGRVATVRSEELGRVYVFTSFHDYNQLLTGGELHGEFRPAGHYNLVTDVVALYLGSIDRARLDDTLVHEAAHMLIIREVFRGRSTERWLGEGLAEYFENTARDAKGGFEKGAVGGRGAKDRLREFKKAAGGKTPWSVASLLDASDPAAFYGEGVESRYAASWLLVHALFHAESGRYADGFARFIERARTAGDASAEALYAATGLDAAKLTALVVAHADSLK